VGRKVVTSVELLWLQKAAGFRHLEDTKLGHKGKARRCGKAGCRGVASVSCNRDELTCRENLLACLCLYLRSRKPTGFIYCVDSMSCRLGAVQSDIGLLCC